MVPINGFFNMVFVQMLFQFLRNLHRIYHKYHIKKSWHSRDIFFTKSSLLFRAKTRTQSGFIVQQKEAVSHHVFSKFSARIFGKIFIKNMRNRTEFFLEFLSNFCHKSTHRFVSKVWENFTSLQLQKCERFTWKNHYKNVREFWIFFIRKSSKGFAQDMLSFTSVLPIILEQSRVKWGQSPPRIHLCQTHFDPESKYRSFIGNLPWVIPFWLKRGPRNPWSPYGLTPTDSSDEQPHFSHQQCCVEIRKVDIEKGIRGGDAKCASHLCGRHSRHPHETSFRPS